MGIHVGRSGLDSEALQRSQQDLLLRVVREAESEGAVAGYVDGDDCGDGEPAISRHSGQFLTRSGNEASLRILPRQGTTPTTGPNAGKINQIPASELSTGEEQIAQKYEAYVPLPKVSGVSNNLNNVYFPNLLFVAQTLERVDENIGENVKLFARFHWQDLTYENGNAVPVGAGFGPANSRNYAFGYTHIITPNLVNDFHIRHQPVHHRLAELLVYPWTDECWNFFGHSRFQLRHH